MIWDINEQRMIKPISSNNEHKFLSLQEEVEFNDLQELIGTEFYQELIRNIGNYSLLLNGGNYTYNGYSYKFRGLKVVCAYLLYAVYVRQSYIEYTFSGLVSSNGDGYQRLSSAELRNQEARHRETAGVAWEECVKYLQTLNLSFFPQKKSTSFKFDML